MGYSFGAAVGAAFATGQRCMVLAGDGAFFMSGLDVHTAIEHQLPITYLIFNNRAHGMCLVRERLLLGENAGYNSFRRSHLGAGLGAMFPGLVACDCQTEASSAEALDRAAQSARDRRVIVDRARGGRNSAVRCVSAVAEALRPHRGAQGGGSR